VYKIVVFSWCPKDRIKYRGAAGVPIAVPFRWCQNVSPNVKMLVFMMDSKTRRNNSVGKFKGIFSLLVLMRLLIEVTPVVVSMLVYIAVASAVKILAFVWM